MKSIRNNKNKFGFTLVETLVALSVVMVGLMAAFSVAQSGVSSSSFAKDRITAFFLAQEAIEAVKNRRDHNLLLSNAGTQTNWLEGITIQGGLPGPCAGGNSCDFDLTAKLEDPSSADSFQSCEILGGCVLQNVSNPLSPGQHYYGYGVGANSKFTRQIIIEEFDGFEASVRIIVTWNNGAHEFETMSYIFNWF